MVDESLVKINTVSFLDLRVCFYWNFWGPVGANLPTMPTGDLQTDIDVQNSNEIAHIFNQLNIAVKFQKIFDVDLHQLNC